MPTRPNAGFRDGKTIRRWATYAKPLIDTSRPDLPDENDDGLDELTEEVIHQAEDITTGSNKRPPGLEDTPVEPREAIENQGEFPGLADQGEESPNPRKRRKSS